MFRAGSRGLFLSLCGIVMIIAWSFGSVYGFSGTVVGKNLSIIQERGRKAPIDSIEVFKEALRDTLSVLGYRNQIQSFYEKNNYQTVLLNRFLRNGQVEYLLGNLEGADDHGLDPEFFRAGAFRTLMEEVNREQSLRTIEAYRKKVKLELLTAYEMLKYCKSMEFGLVEPQTIDPNYFSNRLTADSTFMMRVLEVREVKKYLDSIQPRGDDYKALQLALKFDELAPGKTLKETKSVLSVNMERLRWKNKPTEQRYVMVNIANFSLDVMDQGKSALNMKVCVGQPGRWQSPQLSSKIYGVQVNPVWNIPVSIVKSEILKKVRRDRYYLVNNNIDVYKDEKLVTHTPSIDWSSGDAEGYSFKQMPGELNALGKIKFLFNNESGVYLHDTPLKSAFKKNNRAISHGCIRLEKPMDLALILFGEGAKYDQLKKAMLNGYPKAKFIGLSQSVPIVITYYTAFLDDAGGVGYCKDIYGLDEILSAKMMASK
ncbi:MAG: L,D-transpeptidase family protein [Candidatus Pedobacter colombiensis]|uniref:L,D-transpeptidase family protein n=1 Tax=Candidatus Pedobacter colombiensis TaxID=3121371 RepID=A0AAJ5WAV0_9SPHI|nr:L,D-transpeptidase family protein [Pedobacter sp.]WEK20945.1 MAG: L,D-transpeptidase family protein [Pedobacter sp.]